MLALSLRGRPALTDHSAPVDHVAVAEIAVLRHLDAVTPPELSEPTPLPFFESSGSGDQLRLPFLTHHDGPTLRSAIARVLAADTRTGGAREDVAAEARMRRVLTALSLVQADISRRAQPRL